MNPRSKTEKRRSLRTNYAFLRNLLICDLGVLEMECGCNVRLLFMNTLTLMLRMRIDKMLM